MIFLLARDVRSHFLWSRENFLLKYIAKFCKWKWKIGRKKSYFFPELERMKLRRLCSIPLLMSIWLSTNEIRRRRIAALAFVLWQGM